jgi:hypothetical protein
VTYTRVCRSCRELFTAKRSKARYCSDACRARAWKERPPAATRTRSRHKPSGLQLTRDKAMAAAKRAVFLFAGEVDPDLVQKCVEREINRELSDRQRAQLHARERKTNERKAA